MSEQDTEQKLQDKGLNAPRLTPALIDAVIVGGDYHVFSGSCLTVCCLTLVNGFTVTGESACASPENFNAEIGREIARENARDKVWMLEGYLLKQRLSEMTSIPSTTSDVEPHQQRVIDEKNELDNKATMLSDFIGNNPLFGNLDAGEQERMKEQNDIMWQYSEVLANRISHF